MDERGGLVRCAVWVSEDEAHYGSREYGFFEVVDSVSALDNNWNRGVVLG